jgi:hypothetical protein
MGRKRRRAKRLDASGQRVWEFGQGEAAASEAAAEDAGQKAAGEQWFLPDDARGLRVQEQSLSQYLIEHDLGWVVGLRAFMEQLDFSLMLRAYSAKGRCALHPRTLLGLIVYGMLKRQWTLRELETLAKCDAGAWLMCGGHQPDHSTIGKFIQHHSELLSEEFFADLMRQIAVRLKLRAGVAAVDATVIEAASGRFGLLRAEAARAEAEKARDGRWRIRKTSGWRKRPSWRRRRSRRLRSAMRGAARKATRDRSRWRRRSPRRSISRARMECGARRTSLRCWWSKRHVSWSRGRPRFN